MVWTKIRRRLRYGFGRQPRRVWRPLRQTWGSCTKTDTASELTIGTLQLGSVRLPKKDTQVHSERSVSTTFTAGALNKIFHLQLIGSIKQQNRGKLMLSLSLRFFT